MKLAEWTELYYAHYDANGNVGPAQRAACEACLSDCQPIVWNGKVVWYATYGAAPTFYVLDENGITPHQAVAETGDGTTTQPPANTAYANTIGIVLDGKPVTLQAYALKDAGGGLTNYVRLRDLAYYLNGTKAQFSVDWRAGQGIFLTSGAPYAPDGSELSTPFFGDRTYQNGTNQTTVNGAARNIASIVLTDDNGGDYTYYKLRDMGRNLGFNVSYIGEVVINTNEPYSDAQ